MNNAPTPSTARPDLPSASGRPGAFSRASRAPEPVGSSAATSTWSGAARVVRRLSMPMAWLLTLGICGASAFAVRDVVFPRLGESSAPALWEPRRGDDTVPSLSATSSINSVDGPITTDDVTTTATTLVVATSSSEATASASTAGTTSGRSGTTKAGPATTSPRPTAPSTSAAEGDASSTSSPTSSTDPTSSGPTTSDAPTTSAGTGDTVPDTTSGGGSGSGRGGDRHDPLP